MYGGTDPQGSQFSKEGLINVHHNIQSLKSQITPKMKAALNVVNDVLSKKAKEGRKGDPYGETTADLQNARKALAETGYKTGQQSQVNALQAAIDQDPSGFYGPHGGWVDPQGNIISLADFAAMSPEDASNVTANYSTNLDPNSPFAGLLGAGKMALGFADPSGLLSLVSNIGTGINIASGKPLTGIPGFLSGVVGDIDLGLGEVSLNPFGKETSQGFETAAESIYAPVKRAAQDIYGFVAPPVHDIAESLGLHAEPSQLSVNPRSRGPGIVLPQVPPQVPPLAVPPLEIDHTGPLGTEVQDPLGGDVYESGLISPAYTINELRQYGIGQIPQTTSMFAAHGGFVDKPLYSRS
jgi:hypothetical protein